MNETTRRTPFNRDNKYTGSILCKIIIAEKDGKRMMFPIVKGERLKIEPFTESKFKKLHHAFGTAVKKRSEHKVFKKMFKDRETLGLYNNGEPDKNGQTKKRLNLDSSRILDGNVFTGYKIVKKRTKEPIGRISIGGGYIPGQSQSGIILEKRYQSLDQSNANKYGQEAAVLMAALAVQCFKHQWKVEGAPVHSFTGTANPQNTKSILLMKYLGMEEKTDLLPEEKEQLPDGKKLFEISGEKVNEQFKSLLVDPANVTVRYSNRS